MGNHELSEEKKIAWEAENEDIKNLLSQGAQIFFRKEFPDLKHAFLDKLECVVCMDEGTAHKDIGGEAKLCMAGSGILYPASSEEERVQKVANLFNVLGIKDVTSHGGCGAAGLAFRRDFPGVTPTPEQVDEYAKSWSEKVDEEINRLGSESEYKHIEAGDMERPAEFHTARVAYYDGIGGFNPNKEIGLPMGFVISRHYVPADYVAEELQIAVGIAFGGHGFGDLFSKDLPFIVIIFGRTTETVESLKKEVENILKDVQEYKDGKVKVDGVLIE